MQLDYILPANQGQMTFPDRANDRADDHSTTFTPDNEVQVGIRCYAYTLYTVAEKATHGPLSLLKTRAGRKID